MKDLISLVKLAALYGQLGFTIVTPPVVMALLGHWLQRRFSLGGWLTAVCILLGLAASASGGYGFYRRIIAEQNKKRDETVVFYRHE